MIPVILSGGAGSRLWPTSRRARPKQFLPLLSERSMFQETLERLHGYPGIQAPMVVANQDHRFLVAAELNECAAEHNGIILEPVARNTAAAVALAALHARASAEDPILLVLPADHLIGDRQAFHNCIDQAEKLADAGYLVTFGVTPSLPETGYGYIQCGAALEEATGWRVHRFIEKPDRAKAEEFLREGEFYWNSGMFVFRASVYLAELERLQPELFAACVASMSDAVLDLDFVRADERAFAQAPDISIDYAVMEHTDKAALVALDSAWSDIGAWAALWEASDKDLHGNVCRGDYLAIDTNNSLLMSPNKLAVLLGVDDLVVVDTPDALLVTKRERAQEVKTVVEMLKSAGQSEAEDHREVHRPWGKYDSIDQGARFQVKRITVNPGQRLSLQRHYHRAEHWIVVKGTAEVRRDDEVLLLTENQSTYIPLGAVHNLHNPGKVPLELIEVQSGTYLGEDDIVRLEDDYGRDRH